MKLVPLAKLTTFPDVVWCDAYWLVTYGTEDAQHLVIIRSTGEVVSDSVLPGGSYSSFGRATGTHLVYRSKLNDHAILITFAAPDGPFEDFGRADGLDPVAISGTHVAWQTQDPDGYHVHVKALADLAAPEAIYPGATTGIAWLTPTGAPVLQVDVRESVPGMLCPRYAGSIVLGVHPTDGLIARQLDGWECRIWQGEATNDARVAWDGQDTYAVIAWGPSEGVRLVLITDADFVAPPPPPPPPPPRPPMPEPTINFALVGTVGHVTVREHVETHRWQLDGSNAPTPNDRESYDYSGVAVGAHTADLKARGLPADADHQPWPEGEPPIIYAGAQSFVIAPPPPAPPPADLTKQRTCLQLGFGEPLLPKVLDDCWSWGWNMARLDGMPNHLSPRLMAQYLAETQGDRDEAMRRTIRDLIENARAGGFRPMPGCITSQLPLLPDRSEAEVYGHRTDTSEEGQEPDIVGLDPYEVADQINAQADAFFARGGTLWVGMISNPSTRGRTYLRRLLSRVDRRCHATYHRYPQDGGVPPWIARRDSGYKFRYDETRAVLDIDGDRKMAMSEGGYRRGRWSSPRWWWKVWHASLTEEQIAEYTAWERGHYEAMGCAWWCKYQVGGDAGVIDDQGHPYPVADARRVYVGPHALLGI